MAYSTAYPPVIAHRSRDGSAPSIWTYRSSDPISTITGADYFTAASTVGLRVGDFILVSETDNSYAPAILTVASFSSGAATASAGSGLIMTPGVGISGGTGTIYRAGIERSGGLITTRILVDLTGLNSGGTAGDIIGTNGSGVAHLGQITAQANGTIIGGKLTCLETPATGDTDIDLYAATEGTGVEDAAISGLTSAQLVNAGTASAGTEDILTAFPAADDYLYLVGQGTSNATYTAGRFLIELYGY